MTIDFMHLLHQAFFGALAAAGFGVLFNFGFRTLIWCALSGALALAVRTVGQDAAWSLEAASFIAALVTTSFVLLALRPLLGIDGNFMAITGCIPMVPGAFLAQAILSMFALTAPDVANPEATLVAAVEYTLRVIFTIGAIGAGIAIPSHIIKRA